jgi:hypothetical protein
MAPNLKAAQSWLDGQACMTIRGIEIEREDGAMMQSIAAVRAGTTLIQMAFVVMLLAFAAYAAVRAYERITYDPYAAAMADTRRFHGCQSVVSVINDGPDAEACGRIAQRAADEWAHADSIAFPPTPIH